MKYAPPALWSFTTMNPKSVLASVHIADFLSHALDIPVYSDEQILAHGIPSTLVIVNGAFSFCKHRDVLGDVVAVTPRIIWVQNDYTIYPPTDNGTAQTPFRKAFRVRVQKHGHAPVDRWTTCTQYSNATPYSAYVNWNLLAALRTPRVRKSRVLHDHALLYYGAFRQGRVEAFDTYFKRPHVETFISSASHRFTHYRRLAGLMPPFKSRADLYRALGEYGMGLYIEDKRSHTSFHSPANRFYEMLSARMPMVFQPEAAVSLRAAGINAKRYVVKSAKAVALMMEHRNTLSEEQHDLWWQDYAKQLRRTVQDLWSAYRPHRLQGRGGW